MSTAHNIPHPNTPPPFSHVGEGSVSIGEGVYLTAYSRTKDDGTKEGWYDTVRRVVDGNTKYAPTDEREVRALVEMMDQMIVLPAGRHLFSSGVDGVPVIPNCFHRSTEVLTKEHGNVAIDDIIGQEVHVVDGRGSWQPVSFTRYGTASLKRINLVRYGQTKSVLATADHRWFTTTGSANRSDNEVSTNGLRAKDRLPHLKYKSNRPNVSVYGVQHGFVFGDGSTHSVGATRAYFCGSKDEQVRVRYFQGYEHRSHTGADASYVVGFPRAFKRVPPLDEAPDYLYGFLAGWFAADGCVAKDGSMNISSATIEHIQSMRSLCGVLGIRYGAVKVNMRKGFNDHETPLYSLSICAEDLSEDFFIIDTHRERYLKRKDSLEWAHWSVESVEDSGVVDDVFCCEVATTGSFALSDSVKTGNCLRSVWGSSLCDHLHFMGTQLMMGSGVGTNYSTDPYLAKSRPLKGLKGLQILCRAGHPNYEDVKRESAEFWTEPGDAVNVLMVDDSREGWSDAYCALVSAAEQGRSVVLDVSLVREFGAPLVTFGGTASGPGPLAHALAAMARVLMRIEDRQITPVEAMELDHWIAVATVAGGSRRSAMIAILHWADADIFKFIRCKLDNPEAFWTMNISVEVDGDFFRVLESDTEIGDHARKVLKTVVANMYVNGEPGFYNSELAAVGERGDTRCSNPCNEIVLEESEPCVIGSVDIDACGTDDALALDAVRLLARYLVRSTEGVTEGLPSIADVVRRNRRIGLGLLGVQGWAAAHGVRYADMPDSPVLTTKLRRMAHAARLAADEMADEMGINRPIKVTMEAPNGTTSMLRGTQPGLHPLPGGRYYIRRIRKTNGHPLIAQALADGLHVEPDTYSLNTQVISDVCEDTLVSRYGADVVQEATEVSVADQFRVLAWFTENFTFGTIGNAVSYTANFDPSNTSEGDLFKAVEMYLPVVKGLTAFPAVSRPQSPYEALTKERYDEEVAEIHARRTTPDDLETSAEGAVDMSELSCSQGGSCPLR